MAHANIEYVPNPNSPDTSDKVEGFEVVSERTVSEHEQALEAEKTPVADEVDKAADDLAAVTLAGEPEPAGRTVTVVVVHGRKFKHKGDKHRKDKGRHHKGKRGGSPPPWDGMKHRHGRHRHGPPPPPPPVGRFPGRPGFSRWGRF